MNYKELYQKVIDLPIGEKETILELNGVEIYISRPDKISDKFKEKGYTIEKNFQIFLKEERPFKPNHLRVLIDLNLRTRFRPDLKEKILNLFDNIFYNKQYKELFKELKKEKFEHYLNKDLEITVCLYMLFLIEQNYNYPKESKYDPKTLFFHGWVRQIICDDIELDNSIVSAARGQPPKVGYTEQDSKIKEVTKQKKKMKVDNEKYNSNPKKFWYL